LAGLEQTPLGAGPIASLMTRISFIFTTVFNPLVLIKVDLVQIATRCEINSSYVSSF
jgi:hypothetical protein